MHDNPHASAANLTQLRVGVACGDITPPCEVGLLMSSARGLWAPFESVRLPLKARALALECFGRKMVLVALDLLALNGKAVGGWRQFKSALVHDTADLPGDRVVVTCTHTHTAPESVALTDLYRTAAFQAWVSDLKSTIARTVAAALHSIRPCTVTLASTELRGFSLQRRIPTESGIKMSDSLQPIPPAWFNREPIDNRVRSVIFTASDASTIATLGHAACHPVHEMCIPRVSPDFPGEFCAALGSNPTAGFPLFLNGTAGDINPPTVSSGPEEALRHGQALARVVTAASRTAAPLADAPFHFRRKSIVLPARRLSGAVGKRACMAHLSALRIGPLAILFLPGEIFVQTGRTIEAASPFSTTLVTSLAESTVGYVPTERAFTEGGYEIGPGKWSFLQAQAEPLLVQASLELLRELWSADDEPADVQVSRPSRFRAESVT